MAKSKNVDVNVAEGAAEEASVPTTQASSSGRGRKVVLPTGEARVDYIKRRFFDEGATRSEITKELREITGDAGIQYQIVFAATKTKTEPVVKAESAEEGAEDSEETEL